LLARGHEGTPKLEEYDAFLNDNYDVKAHPIRNLVG